MSAIDLDWEKREPAENLECLDTIIRNCVALLPSLDTKEATTTSSSSSSSSSIGQSQTEACQRLWLETFVEPDYCKVQKHVLSLNDWAFVATCHSLAIHDTDTRKWGRSLMSIDPFTERYAVLKWLHAKVLCCIREMGDFIDDTISLMPHLVRRIAGVVVFCKGESVSRKQKERDARLYSESVASYSNLASEAKERAPAVYDIQDPERVTHNATSKRLRGAGGGNDKGGDEEDDEEKTKESTSGAIAEQDLDNLVELSMAVKSRVDPDAAFVDHRTPSNRNNTKLYVPDVFDMSRFVADCSRLCYWTSCISNFKKLHGDRVYPASQLKRVSTWSKAKVYDTLVQRSKSQIITETQHVFEHLYLTSKCPLGGRDFYNRENTGDRGTHDISTIITSEIGLQAHTYFNKQAAAEPVAIFNQPMEAASKHEAYHAWVWTLWDRIAGQVDIQWLRHWFVTAEQYPVRRWDAVNTLNSTNAWRPWRNETRRPMVYWMGGKYYIQAVQPDFVDRVQQPDDDTDWNEVYADDAFELWETDDCVEAIACWCALMVARHKGEIQHGQSISSLLSELVLNPITEDEIPITENEEDVLRELNLKGFDW